MEVTLDSIRDIRLYQPKKGYRFSVDALLLYNFVNLKYVRSIADLGAGSGIIGILLAKRYPTAHVTLFEIQDSLTTLADKNIALNGLQGRVKAIRCDIKKIKSCFSSLNEHSFDLAVSNPPFRRLRSGHMSVGEEKAIARHELKLRLPELIKAGASLLRAKGRICLVYHPQRFLELIDTLKKKGLEPKRLRFVYSNLSSEAKIILLEAVKGGKGGIKVEKPLYVYREDGSYTDEMRRIYNPQ
jgi:tRNA1Val (adenine37-N6)-methyltransferase